jgi:competence protein ComEC
VSAALVKIFSRALQRYLALVVAIATIALYTVLVGAEPPVVRAAIMGGLSALALIVGRQSDALTSLLAAAWCMTAWDPFLLWDIAFQLSFAASLGLVAYANRLGVGLETLLRRFVSLESAQRTTRLLYDTLLLTVAAQITTLPLMVYHFGHFSPLSLIANLLILPVQPTIMYLGSSAALAGLACLPLGQVLGWAAWLFLAWTIRAVEAMASLIQTSDTTHSVHAAVPLAYYMLLGLFTWGPPAGAISIEKLRRLWMKSTLRKSVFAALLIISVLVWAMVASLPDGKLHVTYLDVGQGDAILVQTPAGHRLLIDGGPSPATLLAALGRRLPFWDRRIDFVLLSHPHEDHLRGLLPVLERYQVRQALAGDVDHDSSVYLEWQQLLQEKGIPLLAVQQALRVDFGDGPSLEILPPEVKNPDSLDDTSLVARLVWQQASFLFTGDLEADGLLAVRDAGWPLSCTVLKVPHHGSADGVSESLLAAARPELAVISVGADNRFGHPAAQTLQCLESGGVQVLRTDEMGTVEVTTDGERYWVRTEGSR